MSDETRPPSLAAALSAAQRPAFERLREGWRARLRPADEAEEAVVDAIVAQRWRAGRLDALEERVVAALLEDRPRAGLPSLATLLRARARLEKERRAAEAELEALRAARPKPVETDRGDVVQPAAGEPVGSGARASRAAEPAAAGERSATPPGPGDARPVSPAVGAARAAEAGTKAAALPPEVEEVIATMWRGDGSGPSRHRLAARA